MEYTIPGAAVGFFFWNSQFIYTFYKFCANNFIIPDQTGAYNIRRRKSSLHRAKHNFTQKAQPFLPCPGVMKWSRDIFTELQRRLTCLSTVALCEGGWSRSISLVKRSACAAREVAACRRVDAFLFTALRLNGGVAAYKYDIFDKNFFTMLWCNF